MDEVPPRLAVALNGYGLSRDDGRRDVLPWHDLLQIARTAEETGYEAILVPEIGAREAFSTLVGFAAATSRVRLATGVAPLGSRDERLMAMEAATVHDLSGGRCILGIGSQLPMAETRRRVRLIRALLAGEPGGPEDLPLDLTAHVPIYLAALGPRMTELAGEVADGVVLNWCTTERVARAREEIARGAAAAGRDPTAVTVAVYVRACIGNEEVQALPALAEAAARYAAMPRYLRQFEAMGLGARAARAARAARGNRSEELVDAVCVRGSREEALGRLGAYAEAGADLVVVYPVPVLDAASSVLGTILAAAPHPAVER